MKNILDVYKEIILELFITSVLLFLICSLGLIGKESVQNKQTVELQSKEIKDYREVYMYDGTVISGNDIVMLLLKYGDRYSYYFDTPNGEVAIRPICIEYPNDDYYKHVHKSKKDCIMGWFVDDLSTINTINYTSSTGNLTSNGCEGGVKTSLRDSIYTSETISKLIGRDLTILFDSNLKRFNYDSLSSSITDTDMLEYYKRRRNDVIGFTFKLK